MLRSIKELEFDHAMRKVSEADFAEISGRLRARALALMQALDSPATAAASAAKPPQHAEPGPAGRPRTSAPSCDTANDPTRGSANSAERSCRHDAACRAVIRSLPCWSLARWRRSSRQARCRIREQMSGVPLPAADMPAGTVSVRVVRGSFANNLPDVAGRVHRRRRERGRHDRRGRPRADQRARGAAPACKAVAVVDGERLESQEVTIGRDRHSRHAGRDRPGSRSARGRGRSSRPGPRSKGTVVLGPESRVVARVRRRPAEHLLRR